jgi:hypothetical protein
MTYEEQNFYVVNFELTKCTTSRIIQPYCDSQPKIAVSPNPSNGVFDVVLNNFGDSSELVTFEIINSTQQIVFTRTKNISEEIFSERLEATILPAGFYLLHIKTGRESHYSKVVIQ